MSDVTVLSINKREVLKTPQQKFSLMHVPPLFASCHQNSTMYVFKTVNVENKRGTNLFILIILSISVLEVWCEVCMCGQQWL